MTTFSKSCIKNIQYIVVLIMLPTIVLATCMTPSQIESIQLITAPLNLTLQQTLDVVGVFEYLCEQNSSFYYNDTYDDSLLKENITELYIMIDNTTIHENWMQDQTYDMKLEVNNTLNSLKKNISEQINNWDQTTEDEIGFAAERLTDIFDDKIQSMKERFVEDIELKAELSRLESRIYDVETEDPYSFYLLVIGVVGIITLVATKQLGPMAKGLIPKVFQKSDKKMVHETVTSEQYKNKIRNLRILKKNIVDRKLSDNIKRILLNKVDLQEINNIDDIEDEIKILTVISSSKPASKSRSKKGGKRKK